MCTLGSIIFAVSRPRPVSPLCHKDTLNCLVCCRRRPFAPYPPQPQPQPQPQPHWVTVVASWFKLPLPAPSTTPGDQTSLRETFEDDRAIIQEVNIPHPQPPARSRGLFPSPLAVVSLVLAGEKRGAMSRLIETGCERLSPSMPITCNAEACSSLAGLQYFQVVSQTDLCIIYLDFE